MIDKIIERLEEEKTKKEKIAQKYSSDNLTDIYNEYDATEFEMEMLDMAINIVKQVAEEGGWIKCSDRMPDKTITRPILFTTGADYQIGGYRSMANDETAWYSTSCNKYINRRVVIAWQPLPKPFKESD